MSKDSSQPTTHQDTLSKPQNSSLQEHTQRLQDEALKNLSTVSKKQLNEEQARDSILEDRTQDKPKFKIKVIKSVEKDHSDIREIPENGYPPPVRLIQDKTGKITQLEFPPALPNK